MRLAHHCGADDHAERVEYDFCLVPVRVTYEPGLQYAVIDGVHSYAIAYRVPSLDGRRSYAGLFGSDGRSKVTAVECPKGSR